MRPATAIQRFLVAVSMNQEVQGRIAFYIVPGQSTTTGSQLLLQKMIQHLHMTGDAPSLFGVIQQIRQIIGQRRSTTGFADQQRYPVCKQCVESLKKPREIG